MTAHRYSQSRQAIQRRVQADLARREKRNEGRGLLAAELVRDWTPEQRARIRNDPLTPPELAELIDQINKASS